VFLDESDSKHALLNHKTKITVRTKKENAHLKQECLKWIIYALRVHPACVFLAESDSKHALLYHATNLRVRKKKKMRM